ncbi:hypothetical protein PVAP13_9KG423200 [Panicum virgatum]|uniref:Uncharacterized protein n=1 Tax=Panicum virgatum TaxID=38727 RepID=A0A8T0NZ03_PANVG|nr:hypothetical protein PVAP13_9KG423200 [Panicum virgatum]
MAAQKMQIIKRGGGDLITLKESKMTGNNGGETIESLIAGYVGELSQEVASNLSKSVVSIAVSDGNTVLFTCSGIAIEQEGYVTRFLTSANLASALNGKTKDHDNLKVEVRHEGNVVIGFLGKCDFDLGIAVVNITTFLNVQVVLLNHLMVFLPYSKVVAVGRGISGKLMATSGMLTPDASGSEDSEDLMLSTCKISEERTLFLPTSIIFGRLVHFQLSLRRSKFLAQLKNLKAVSVEKVLTKRGGADLSRTLKNDERTDDLTRLKHNITDDPASSSNKNKRTDDLANSWKKNKRTCYGGDVLNEDPFWYLNSMGYPPKIDIPSDDLVLVNNFEDTFGDMYGGGVWSELSETVASDISRNVVSLASFYGEKRIFACTGFFY